MYYRILFLSINFIFLSTFSTYAQPYDSDSGKRFIGTTAFILANLVPNQENPPNLMQLHFGYWLTKRDVISLEAITWKYNSPLGIPYGSSFDDPTQAYPGYVREFGIGIVYQRFLWRGLYAAAHALPLFQHYTETATNKSQNSFKLFLTARAGYQIKLFDKFFLEPSLACTYWPITTNEPASFTAVDKKWPNYFLFEPGLHCGVKF